MILAGEPDTCGLQVESYTTPYADGKAGRVCGRDQPPGIKIKLGIKRALSEMTCKHFHQRPCFLKRFM